MAFHWALPGCESARLKMTVTGPVVHLELTVRAGPSGLFEAEEFHRSLGQGEEATVSFGRWLERHDDKLTLRFPAWPQAVDIEVEMEGNPTFQVPDTVPAGQSWALEVEPDLSPPGRAWRHQDTVLVSASAPDSVVDLPKDVIFLLDLSAGASARWPAVRRGVETFIGHLKADDRVALIGFADGIMAGFSGGSLVQAASFPSAIAWLEQVVCEGRFEFLSSLQAAMSQFREVSRFQMLVPVLSRQPDRLMIACAKPMLSTAFGIRIFPLTPEPGLFSRLAERVGRGQALWGCPERNLTTLARYCSSPRVTDLRVTGGFTPIWPERAPDLLAGTPTFLLGEVEPTPNLKLRGITAEGMWEEHLSVEPSDNPALSLVARSALARHQEDEIEPELPEKFLEEARLLLNTLLSQMGTFDGGRASLAVEMGHPVVRFSVHDTQQFVAIPWKLYLPLIRVLEQWAPDFSPAEVFARVPDDESALRLTFEHYYHGRRVHFELLPLEPETTARELSDRIRSIRSKISHLTRWERPPETLWEEKPTPDQITSDSQLNAWLQNHYRPLHQEMVRLSSLLAWAGGLDERWTDLEGLPFVRVTPGWDFVIEEWLKRCEAVAKS